VPLLNLMGCGVTEPGSEWRTGRILNGTRRPGPPQPAVSVDSGLVLDLPGSLALYGVAHGLHLHWRMTDPVD